MNAPSEVRTHHVGMNAAAAVVLAASMAAGRKGALVRGEASAFRWLNDLPHTFAPPVVVLMQGGNGLMALGAPLIGMAARVSPRRAVASGIAAFAGWQLAKGVKSLVQRGRPTYFFNDVQLRDGDPSGLGLVSGHATVAFAVATTLAPELSSSARRVAFLAAGGVGLARVYVGAHLPLDVIGGSALGILVGHAAEALSG